MPGRVAFVLVAVAAAMAAGVAADGADIVFEANGRRQTLVTAAADGSLTPAPARCTPAGGSTAPRVRADGAAVEPLQALMPGSRERAVVQPAIERVFAERARELGVAASARSGLSPSFVAHSSTAAPGTVHFAAPQRIPDRSPAVPDSDPKGDVVIAVNGWMRIEGERATPIGVASELGWEQVDGDRPAAGPAAAPMPTPLAVVAFGDRRIWVVTDRGTVSVFLVDATRVRAIVRSRPIECR